MKNKTKGVIAGVAGVALLTGGSTFALWSAEDEVAGGTITNGELGVVAVDAMEWRDVSEDRTDAGHVITPATWRMVPGDVARGTQQLTVTLDGDNLVAELAVGTTAITLPDDVTVGYRLLDGTTELGAGEFGDPLELRFAASTTSQGSPADTIVVNGSKTLTVELTVAFDEDAEGSMTEASVLGDLAITLEQQRSGGGFA